MRTVQGETNAACKVPHGQLINHYYSEPERTPDLSIYENVKKAATRPLSTFTEVLRLRGKNLNTHF